jgi:hypothetical protein
MKNRRLVSLSLHEAVFAINWFAFDRLERDFTFFLAFRASCLVHFPWTKISLESASKSFHLIIFPPYINDILEKVTFLICSTKISNYDFINI